MEIQWSLNQITEAQIFIVSLIFILGYAFYRQLVRTEKAEKMVVFVNGKIEATEGFLNWAKTKRKLTAKGVAFYHPSFLKPHNYILLHLFTSVAGFMLVWMWLQSPIAILGMMVGLAFPTVYFNSVDKSDNEELINDAMTISNVLSLQLRGGEFVGVALAECREIVYHKRLRTALEELDRHLKLQDMTLNEAITDLSSKFDSPEIDTICLILKQGMETGRMTECSADLSRQCSASKQGVFERQKAKLDRTLTYVMLMLFGAGIGFLMWRFMETFTSTMGDMGVM